MVDFLTNIFEFVAFTVILKYIIGHWLAGEIIKYSKQLFGKSERHTAIMAHYQNHAQGLGHESRSVTDCKQDRCTVFSMA